jgi:hypothetical protein
MSDTDRRTDRWQPTRIVRFESNPVATSTGAVNVKSDQSSPILKALANPEGPHALASDFLGSRLAKWFGLQVPECAIIPLPAELNFAFPGGGKSEAGSAFVSRYIDAQTWDRSQHDLDRVSNSDDFTRLVVFDTWIRNRDRCPPPGSLRAPNYANVLLAEHPTNRNFRIVAIDHTHAFTDQGEWTRRISDLQYVRDEATYGLFPEFAGRIRQEVLQACGQRLGEFTREIAQVILDQLPADWQVASEAREAMLRFLCNRAVFLADRILQGWVPGIPLAE